VNLFCRATIGFGWGGGACIYVKKFLGIREVNYFQNMNGEKNFEIAVIELLGYKIIVV
jgi:hypothetical protein